MPYYAVLHVLSNYFSVAVLVGGPGVVLAAAGLVAGACTGLVCPCRRNVAFNTFVNAILCCFHSFI